jgi:hypothetical protein
MRGDFTGGTPRRRDTSPGDAQSACRVRERATQARRAVLGVAVVRVLLWRAAFRDDRLGSEEARWFGTAG